MLYAREVIDLLAAFPGRQWKMHHIVNHVARGKPANKQERNRYRQGVRRVILALVDCGSVEYQPPLRGAPALYLWKVQHAEGEKREQGCDNSAREVASRIGAETEFAD